jgi:hypothetical protein
MRERVGGRLDLIEGARLGQRLARTVFGIARSMNNRMDLELDLSPCLLLLRPPEAEEPTWRRRLLLRVT